MSKLLTILTFFVAFIVTSIAFADSSKPIDCATSNRKIRYQGIETLVTENGVQQYKYEGEFFLDTPRSDRNYVVGEISRDTGTLRTLVEEQAFLATASVLVVDATECSRDSQSANHCTLVRRATLPMLCTYSLENF